MNRVKNKRKKPEKMLPAAMLALACLLFACRGNETPKPHSYFRIDLPEKNYRMYDSICPFAFEYPVYGTLTPDAATGSNTCWFNVEFPKYRGTIYLTYREINNNFDRLIEDDWKIVFSKIAQKATDIVPYEYSNPKRNVYGTIYDIKGNAASSLQFFATDSARHFLRGSLYFAVKPNHDSLAPVIAFFREDVVRMMETLRWKDNVGKTANNKK